jgi:hypothetical protein
MAVSNHVADQFQMEGCVVKKKPTQNNKTCTSKEADELIRLKIVSILNKLRTDDANLFPKS